MSEANIAQIIARHSDSMEDLSLYLRQIGEMMRGMAQQIRAMETLFLTLEKRVAHLEARL